MIGIESIGTYLPPDRLDNVKRASDLGATPQQVEDRIGFRKAAQMAKGDSALSLATGAINKLSEQQALDLSSIQVLVAVTQNPDRNIPHLSAEIHGAMELPESCACFDIGLGCSGYVYALSIIKAFMETNGFSRGLLITADPYSKIVNQSDKNTALIFGDGATATLISDNPIFEPGSFLFGTRGADADKLVCNDATLFMNGRAVFNFAVKQIPNEINMLVQKNGLSLDKVDSFILHQGSRYIVETIADRLHVSRDKVPFLSAEYGNTVSSSIPMVLADVMQDSAKRTIVLSGFGVGLSWASTIIKRRI